MPGGGKIAARRGAPWRGGYERHVAVKIEISAPAGLAPLDARHPEDFGVLGGGDGLGAEALALLDDEHFGELGVGLEIRERNRRGEFFDGAHVDHEPAGLVG